MGWLHGKPKNWSESRLDRYRTSHKRLPPMPEVTAGQYLVEAFNELGRVSAGFSMIPLTWGEIDAYARLTGEISERFEARALRRMSAAYIEGYRLSEDEFSIPPWQPVSEG
jgi:hypothetical protein